jgi:PAS domain-containing protein
MIVIDRSGVIEFANPAALALFSLSGHEMIGKSLGSPIMGHEYVDMEFIRGFKKVTAAEMRMVDVEWEGKPSHLISFRDVSGHIKLEEELRQARDDLEIRVRERTSDLVAANEKMGREIEERKIAEEKLQNINEELATTEEELRVGLEELSMSNGKLEHNVEVLNAVLKITLPRMYLTFSSTAINSAVICTATTEPNAYCTVTVIDFQKNGSSVNSST